MSATKDDMAALCEELERLRKENADMKKRVGLTFKISDRNRVGIVFGTYTCSLFKNQWLKILEHQKDLKQFIEENNEELD